MIRPQQNDEPASQWRSPAAQSSGPGRGDTAPVAATVGVVGGSMSGKGSGVNTGDPWGRTAVSGSRAGVRAIIVAVKRVMIVERRVAGRRTRDGRQAAKTNALVPIGLIGAWRRACCKACKRVRNTAKTKAGHWMDCLMHPKASMNCLPSKESNLRGSHSPTGEPDAGNLPVRFGGRGGATQCAVPTSILGSRCHRHALHGGEITHWRGVIIILELVLAHLGRAGH